MGIYGAYSRQGFRGRLQASEIKSSIWAVSRQMTRQTLQQDQSKYKKRPWCHPTRRIFAVGSANGEEKGNKKKRWAKGIRVTLTALQRLDLGSLRRFCRLLPLFEDSGYIPLTICANGFPISSFVFRQRSSLSSHSACTLSVSRRFVSALAALTLRPERRFCPGAPPRCCSGA